MRLFYFGDVSVWCESILCLDKVLVMVLLSVLENFGGVMIIFIFRETRVS